MSGGSVLERMANIGSGEVEFIEMMSVENYPVEKRHGYNKTLCFFIIIMCCMCSTIPKYVQLFSTLELIQLGLGKSNQEHILRIFSYKFHSEEIHHRCIGHHLYQVHYNP